MQALENGLAHTNLMPAELSGGMKRRIVLKENTNSTT
jgi:ABC-type transporter Mla maintaining outer membrane lipid asymmetry ATPase subunit MlaF